MAVVGIIPARLASTRFPRKLLAHDTGHPLVRHVYDAAAAAPMLDRVVIATEDEEIASAVRSFGGEAVMTGEHPNGTSRLAEAAERLGLADSDIVVNIQGDEPELDPGAIGAAVRSLGAAEAADRQVGTVAAPLAFPEEFSDPNVVKVVTDLNGRALLFSRAPIPNPREGRHESGAEPLRHVGLYSYTVGFLARYVTLEETPLERTERLEQLRVLEHGYAIGVERISHAHAGIDTPEQYSAFVARWRSGQGS
ncbi:MAG: 3-deoxy-manno-octulosonate cytidylyltransferase [Planctomycetota bacterium]